MNSLNSILIEGDVVETPSQFDTLAAHFTIESTHNDERILVRVVAYKRLGQSCVENLELGRGVRVVGRLSGHPDKTLIVAEHVEFKPKR